MLKKFFCFLAIIYYGCCFNLTHLYSNDQKIMIAVDAYFGPPNTPPIITNLFVTETSGNISILYDLVDNESNLCTVALEYSEAGSAIWYPASISGTITDITPIQDWK
ncbi:MAG: hypothetical protein H7A34_01930 [bacterium]|nr:hypothetical protein [bacterium]